MSRFPTQNQTYNSTFSPLPIFAPQTHTLSISVVPNYLRRFPNGKSLSAFLKKGDSNELLREKKKANEKVFVIDAECFLPVTNHWFRFDYTSPIEFFYLFGWYSINKILKCWNATKNFGPAEQWYSNRSMSHFEM